MARVKIKISLFAAPGFGNAISISSVAQGYLLLWPLLPLLWRFFHPV